MWADQVSSSDEVPLAASGSVKKKASGYSVGDAEADGEPGRALKLTEIPSEEFVSTEIIHDHELSEAVPDLAPSDALAESTSAEGGQPEGSMKTTSLHDDKSETVLPSAAPAAAVAFPNFVFPATSEPIEIADDRAPTPAIGPSVTFGSNINSPPSRTGTPDPESEPKRKRISSQNFQRLARRISLTTRRQGSSSTILTGIPGIPGLGKRDSSPRASTDEGSKAESIVPKSIDSAAEGDKPRLKKKDKRNKKGSL